MKSRGRGETVLLIGAEGGSISIERLLDSRGRWHYLASTDESTLWDMLDEPTSGHHRDEADAPVLSKEPPTLDDALRRIGRYPWPRLHPIEAHPEFEAAILQAARFHPQADADTLERFARELTRASAHHRTRRSPHEAAVRIAAIVHRLQLRKGTRLPYVSHVVTVSNLLAEAELPSAVVLAGLLHDVLEDFEHDEATAAALRESFPAFEAGTTKASMRDALRQLIAKEVGQEVRWLVEAVTEQKDTAGDERRPWKIRKLEQVRHLRGADSRVAALKAADALHNIQSIADDSRKAEQGVFERFNAPADDLIWYYGTVAALCARCLGPANRLAILLAEAIRDLEGEVERSLGSRDLFTGLRERGRHDLEPTAVVVEGRLGRIADIESWRVLAPPARPGHWRPGRSAMESARSWFAADAVEPTVPAAIRRLLDSHPDTAGTVVRTVRPEHETRLDRLGRGRQHDVVAYGLKGEQRVVIAIEAKADESFGDLISAELGRADSANEGRREGDGPATRKRERIEQLSMRVFGRVPDAVIEGLRYQLLHALAGAVIEAEATGAFMACLVVQEFTGPGTGETPVKRNEDDFLAFLRALGVETADRALHGTLFGPVVLQTTGGQDAAVYIGKVTTATQSQ